MALSQPQMAATKATRILIVEDEDDSARAIESGLLKTGHEVVGIARSSAEALAKIAESSPELILMDIRIEGSTNEISDIPLIYVASQTDLERVDGANIDRAKKAGAFGILTKPIHPASLATSIELAMHKHQAERESRHELVRMAEILNTMADAVAVIDRNRKIQFQNRAAEELTGWVNEDARGVDIGQVLPLVESASGAAASQVLSAPSNPRRPNRLPRGIIASTRAGKRFPMEGELAASVDGDTVAGAVITFRDGSSRQAQENELRQQDKMQAVGRFAAGIAHDFNNLLFIILGYTEEMLHTSGLTESGRQALTAIKMAGESATSITDLLLKFSRKGSTEKRNVNLNEVIRETEELLRQPNGSIIEWQFRFDKDLAPVRADPGELKQVLLSLVANAREAMPDGGGRITIETVNLDVSQSAAEVQQPCVALRVSDTGRGMTAEIAQHLFEPFYTTKRPGKGTGLGMTIAHSIVTDLGGTIHVNSEPGRGATLTIILPRAGTATGLSVAPATILLADDEAGVRNLLRSYLAREGHTVLEAEDGEDAIRVANEHAGSIDLLITDVMMPKATGFDVARALSGRAGMKIMLISGHARDLANGLESLPSGARFLPKPFKKAEFLKTVNELLGMEETRTMKSMV